MLFYCCGNFKLLLYNTLKDMNIQETTTYELTETEVRASIHYAFTQKLKGLNKNAFFDTHNIIIEGYENGALARLVLTENSEI